MISGDPCALNLASSMYSRLLMMADSVDELNVFVPANDSKSNKVSLGARGVVRGFVGYKINVAIAMIREGREVDCDIVTAQDPFWLGLVALRISKRLGVPLHIQVHTDVFSPSYWSASFGNYVKFCIARGVLKRANCIRVVSERIAESMRVSGITAPISVLPIFIDIDAIVNAKTIDLKKEYPQFSQLILIAARLEKEKRVDSLFRVMHDVCKEIPQVGLFVAGDGSQHFELEMLARTMGIESHVVFLGRRQDIFSLYKSVDLVLAATATYEGYGASTVEALCAGVPVVSEDVGVARDAGAIIATRDNFAKAAVRALQSNVAGLLKVKLPTCDEWVDQWKAGLCVL